MYLSINNYDNEPISFFINHANSIKKLNFFFHHFRFTGNSILTNINLDINQQDKFNYILAKKENFYSLFKNEIPSIKNISVVPDFLLNSSNNNKLKLLLFCYMRSYFDPLISYNDLLTNHFCFSSNILHNPI